MKKVIVSIFALMALAGCSKLGEGGKDIHFKVTSDDTKGTAISSTSINQAGQTFAIDAYADASYKDNETNESYSAGKYFSGLLATCDGTQWSTSEVKNWLNGVNLRFWSYAPVSVNGKRVISDPEVLASKLSFTYDLPAANGSADATNQEDLIFAYNSETRNFNSAGSITGGDSQYVYIHFYHALSEVTVAVSPDDGSFDVDGLEIESIELSDVYGSGSCEFDGSAHTFAWSSLTAKTDYTQTIQQGFRTQPEGWTLGSFKTSDGTYKLYNYSNAFFMIPQAATAVNLSVAFKRLSDNTIITKSVTLDGQWLAGKYYKYKISAKSLNNTILFGVTVTEWGEGEINIDVQ